MRIILLFFLAFNTLQSFAQSDSLIQKFLLENKELDTIIYNAKKEKGKTLIESNYYAVECINIDSKDCLIKGYKFGSNSSLRKTFILMDVSNNNQHKYYFFGKNGFENDLKNIFNIFCSSKLIDADKKNIIQTIMNVYIASILESSCEPVKNVL